MLCNYPEAILKSRKRCQICQLTLSNLTQTHSDHALPKTQIAKSSENNVKTSNVSITIFSHRAGMAKLQPSNLFLRPLTFFHVKKTLQKSNKWLNFQKNLWFSLKKHKIWSKRGEMAFKISTWQKFQLWDQNWKRILKSGRWKKNNSGHPWYIG